MRVGKKVPGRRNGILNRAGHVQRVRASAGGWDKLCGSAWGWRWVLSSLSVLSICDLFRWGGALELLAPLTTHPASSSLRPQTRSHSIAQAVLELVMYPRQALNSCQPACLSLPSAKITGVSYHTHSLLVPLPVFLPQV